MCRSQLNIANNRLCGIWTEWEGLSEWERLSDVQKGTYTAEGIVAIAGALCVHGGLTSLDISHNQIGGYYKDGDFGEIIYTPEGPKALADALCINGVLTSLLLSDNSLKDEGISAICEAIKSNKDTKIASLDFHDNNVGRAGAHSVAAIMAVTGGLTSVSLLGNKFDMDDASMLLKIKEEKPNLHTLCGLTHDETELNYRNHHYGPADAMLIAAEIPVMGGLTSV